MPPPRMVWPFLPTTASWIFGWTGPCLSTPASEETVTPAVIEDGPGWCQTREGTTASRDSLSS